MSEKRIYCIEVSGECQHLMNVNRPSLAHLCGSSLGLYCTKNFCWKPITKDACKNCKHAEYKGITREKFIMVVAKAICKTDGESCITCGFNCNEKGCKQYLKFGNYITQAEAVLEDILEDNNGSNTSRV